jgi:hypothetical protein
VGVPQEVINAIKFREPTDTMAKPFGIVVQLIRETFTERSVRAEIYDAVVSLLGVPRLIALMPLRGRTQALPRCLKCLTCS